MKKILAIVLAVVMLLPVFAVNTFAAVDTSVETVIYENAEGYQFTIVDNGETKVIFPYHGFGVGASAIDGRNVGDIAIADIVEYAKAGASLVMTYSRDDTYWGSNPAAPEVEFNGFDNDSDPEALKFVNVYNNDINDTYTGTVNLGDVLAAYEAKDPDGNIANISNCTIQVWCENFKLYKLSLVPASKPVSIGETGYATLQEAVDAAKDGDVINVNQDIMDGTGVKLMAAESGKNITIDFGGHTYNVADTCVGSVGYESQGFHLEKGHTVTMKNGNITSTDPDCRMLIQKYCDLTLTDMVLEGNTNIGYVLSNNNGSTLINGESYIITDKVAFDVYYWPTNGYGNVSVTVDTTGRIEGDIELSASADDKTAEEIAAAMSLTINNGTINGDILIDKDNLKIEDLVDHTEKFDLLKEENYLPLYGNSDGVVWSKDDATGLESVTVDGNDGIVLKLPKTLMNGESVNVRVRATTESTEFRAYLSANNKDGYSNIVTLSPADAATGKEIVLTANDDNVNTILIKPQRGEQLVNTNITKVMFANYITYTEEEKLANVYDSVKGIVTLNGGLYSDKVAVEHLYEGETYEENGLIGLGKKSYKGDNNSTSGYIYVNEEYHALLINGAFIVYPHDIDEGFCLTCRAVIEGEDEDDIEVIDPTEPGDTPTEDEEPGDIDVEEPAPDEPEDENPATGGCFVVLPLVLAVAAAAASKRR